MAEITVAQPSFTCPEVHVEACPKPVECKPEIKIQREYVGPIPHWCEGNVCTGSEVAGFVILILVLLAAGIGAYALFTHVKNIVRDDGLDGARKAADLEKTRLATQREHALENLKIEQQRLDMIHADKLREDQRSLALAKAKLDPMTYGIDTK